MNNTHIQSLLLHNIHRAHLISNVIKHRIKRSGQRRNKKQNNKTQHNIGIRKLSGILSKPRIHIPDIKRSSRNIILSTNNECQQKKKNIQDF